MTTTTNAALANALRNLAAWVRANASPVHNPDAHELLLEAEAALRGAGEQLLTPRERRGRIIDGTAWCCVCGEVPVDVEDGYDTCAGCIRDHNA